MDLGNIEKGLPIQVPCIPTECDPKLYQAAGIDFIRALCESVYTNEETSLKVRFNEIISDLVLKSLDDQKPSAETGKTMSDEIRTVIIGDASNPGLKKYIQELFTFSAHSTDDKIYSFTSRVLQGLFKKNNRLIPEILSQAIIQLRENSIAPTSKDVLKQMTEILKNRLDINQEASVITGGGGSLSDVVSSVVSSIEPSTESKPKDNVMNTSTMTTQPNLSESCMKLDAEKKELSNEFVTLNEKKVNISEKDAKILKEIYDKLVPEANESQAFLINTIVSNYKGKPFGEVIQENILKALAKMFKHSKESIYEKITESIIQKYTNEFIENGTIQLLILHSILSYEKTGDSSADNTFSKAHTIFETSIHKIIELIRQQDETNDFSSIPNDTIENMCLGDDGKTFGIMFQLHNNLFDEISSTPSLINPLPRVLKELGNATGGKKSKSTKRTKTSISKKSAKKSKSKKSMKKSKNRKSRNSRK